MNYIIRKAKLIKLKTDDGLFEMFSHIELGKEYFVNLDTQKTRIGYSALHKKNWEREMIRTVDGGLLPTELLEIEKLPGDEPQEKGDTQ